MTVNVDTPALRALFQQIREGGFFYPDRENDCIAFLNSTISGIQAVAERAGFQKGCDSKDAIADQLILSLRDRAEKAEAELARVKADAKPVVRLQSRISDRPYSEGMVVYDIVILDKEQCRDDLELYAAPVVKAETTVERQLQIGDTVEIQQGVKAAGFDYSGMQGTIVDFDIEGMHGVNVDFADGDAIFCSYNEVTFVSSAPPAKDNTGGSTLTPDQLGEVIEALDLAQLGGSSINSTYYAEFQRLQYRARCHLLGRKPIDDVKTFTPELAWEQVRNIPNIPDGIYAQLKKALLNPGEKI